MNNKKIIGVVVGIIIVIIIGYLLMNKGANNTGGISNSGSETTGGGQGQKSFKTLLAQGGSQKCSVSYATGGVSSQGTVYVSSGKMRGDFSTAVNGQTNVAHMLIEDSNTYTWMEGMNMGYKMKVDTSAAAGTNGSQNQVDLNQQVDYQCSSWSADPSLFNLPSGINFTDTAALQAGASASSSGSSYQCSACDQLSGDAKAQCRAALNCK